VLQRLARELARAGRRGHLTAVVLADLDRLKSINDRYGPRAGDEALREAATRIGASVRRGDVFGRYAGQEFLIVLHRCDSGQAAAFAERIREQITAVPVVIAGFTISLSVSLGVAATRGRQTPPAALLEAADAALYRAKALGRKRVVAAKDCDLASRQRCL
jgi:diguanylate cyclase (GGDEF)-like protein